MRTKIAAAMTALALLGFSLSGSFLPLCFLSIPLGLGAGAIDTGLNNYVALHYSSSQMSLLHCFYGIGITISPYLMSRLLSTDAGCFSAGSCGSSGSIQSACQTAGSVP